MPKASTLLYETVEVSKKGPGKGSGGGGGSGRKRGTRQDVTLFPSVDFDRLQAHCVLCCVDDTDDLSGDTSTGFVSERIADAVAQLGGQVVLGITRHQLLLAEGVPYTSHNSAMCFMALMPAGGAAELSNVAVKALAQHSAPSADPGLCIAELPLDPDDQVTVDVERLMSFGKRAKVELCTKDEAYALAASIPWVHLSEHGGTGDGIIGALAGVGLRLGGCDGRFRGKWNLAAIFDRIDSVEVSSASTVTVGDFCDALSSRTEGNVMVADVQGQCIARDTLLVLEEEAKPIMRDGCLCIVAEVDDQGVARPCSKVDLGSIGNDEGWNQYCSSFAFDNDREECATDLKKTCRNCLYRRFTSRGFMCVATASAGSA